jgi:hypothetical protein
LDLHDFLQNSIGFLIKIKEWKNENDWEEKTAPKGLLLTEK